MCWEVCVLLIESGEFCYFLWKCRTCLTRYWHSAPFFFHFRIKESFRFCRIKIASSVSLLQNQVCVFCSSLAEPRLRLHFGCCRTKTSSVRPLQSQGYCFISLPAEPKTVSSFPLLRNEYHLFILSSAEPRLSSVRFLHFTFTKAESPS
jgi:hypothetical protein